LNGKDKISDNYSKQVDELLDNQSGLNLFDPLNQEELDEIWKEISTEMDIGEVWNNISSDLDTVMPVDSGSGIIFKSIAVVLIILIGMIPVKKAILDSGISQPDILTENKQNEQPAELVAKNKPGDSSKGEQVKGDILSALRSSLDKSEVGNKPTPAERNITVLAQGTPMPVSNVADSKILSASGMADSNLVVSRDKISIEISNIPPALFPDGLKKIKLLSKTDFNSLKINDNSSTAGSSLPLIDRGRISGGLITLFKNTWLLNHETFDGFKSESLTTTEIVFHPDVGLSLSYSLNKNWLLQADGFFFSNTGQEYLGYYDGHYGRKKTTLRYSTIALSVKNKFSDINRFIPRSSINLLAGGYLSVLQYANQEKNTVLENIRSQYGKFDFGVRLGGEFELQIFDQLSIAPGLFLSIGIPNIYKGNSNIPGYLRRTHNGSAEFHLAFYFHSD
jgi:hypothetical protein